MSGGLEEFMKKIKALPPTLYLIPLSASIFRLS